MSFEATSYRQCPYHRHNIPIPHEDKEGTESAVSDDSIISGNIHIITGVTRYSVWAKVHVVTNCMMNHCKATYYIHSSCWVLQTAQLAFACIPLAGLET